MRSSMLPKDINQGGLRHQLTHKRKREVRRSMDTFLSSLIDVGSSNPTTFARKPAIAKGFVSVPSLYPVYLPLKSQHRLLVKVQAVLEDACYNFGSKEMGDELQENGWDSPECVELNMWMQLFLKRTELFAPDKIKSLGKQFPAFLTAIAQIRHTAVHRLPVSAKSIEQFMVEAGQLAMLLDD